MASTQAALEATAAASAIAATNAQAAFGLAEAALIAADVTTFVPSMEDIMNAVVGGYINPGELSISRVISDDDPTNTDSDSALYSGNRSDYTITTLAGGFTQVLDNSSPPRACSSNTRSHCSTWE